MSQSLPPRLPAGFRISSINDRFHDLGALGNFAEVIEEIESCWNSVGDFRRAGFGFVAHDSQQIACWCTAECVSDGRCGIGIETVSAYQQQGFATLTASAFVDHCIDTGMTAYWDAWTDNLPSVAVAEKIGFSKAETYSIFVGGRSPVGAGVAGQQECQPEAGEEGADADESGDR